MHDQNSTRIVEDIHLSRWDCVVFCGKFLRVWNDDYKINVTQD